MQRRRLYVHARHEKPPSISPADQQFVFVPARATGVSLRRRLVRGSHPARIAVFGFFGW
jgi:hypothetical protein